MTDVIIVGAGISGLVAADILSAANFSTLILEARPRIGGRIYTVATSGPDPETPPIELGAEFVHGAKNETWPMIKEARLKVHEVPDRHWQIQAGKFVERKNFWDLLDQVFSKIDEKGADQDFLSFLRQTQGIPKDAAKLARSYVEGFHAASPDRISVLAITKAEAAAERTEGTRAFRLAQGYTQLIARLVARLHSRQQMLLCNHVVKHIQWEPHRVNVICHSLAGEEVFSAARLIVTVPLGVLKQREGNASFQFDPPLEQHQTAIDSLEMGLVTKLTYRFRSRIWPVANFGFLHAEDESLPTWWSHDRAPIVTGWAGGPKAKAFSHEARETVIADGLASLARLLKLERRRLEENLVDCHFHDWTNDPFSQGAYSYTPVGALHAAEKLREAIANTIYFAGEATHHRGDQGTVHGAIATGQRVAREIVQTLKLRSKRRRAPVRHTHSSARRSPRASRRA
jgi:monoamine oxidase